MSRGATPPEQVYRVPVDLEQLGGDGDVGMFLAQARKVLPVDRAAISAEKIGPGEQVRAGADRPERYPALGEPAQPGETCLVDMALDLLARADDDEVGVLDRPEVPVDLYEETAAARDRRPPHTDDPPAVQLLSAHPVRHP